MRWAAFEVVFIPHNKFKEYDFNSGWNPTFSPPRAQNVWVYTKKDRQEESSMTVFLILWDKVVVTAH